MEPTRDDLRYLKRFLDETAESLNERVGNRLALVLTNIHRGNPALFTPQRVADRATREFRIALTVAGATGAEAGP